MCIRDRDNTSNNAPILYLDDFYNRFQDGTPFPVIVEDFMDLLHYATDVTLTDTSSFSNYELLRIRICYKLVNLKANQEQLKDIPYIPCLDLAIVFYMLFDCKKDGRIATMLIRNKHLKLWKQDLRTLLSDAHRNTQTLLPA